MNTQERIAWDALPFNVKRLSSLRSATLVAAVGAVIVGVAALVARLFDVTAVRGVLPAWGTMKANAALAFVLAGTSLSLHLRRRPDRTAWDRVALALAVAVTVIGGLTLAEYILGVNLRIDELLFTEPPGTAGNSVPGRMGSNTALCFVLVGAALSLLRVETRSRVRTSEVLALFAAVIVLLALAGYFYGVQPLLGIASHTHTQMAAHTAFTLLLLVLGVLFAHPDRGLIAVVTNDTAGGTLARRALPVVIAGPVALGWLTLWGEHAEFYQEEMGVSLLVLCLILLFVALLLSNATTLTRTDLARSTAATGLQRMNEQLERRVEERSVQLEAANRELEAFSYSVAHDLRAPLRGMSGFAKVLLDDYDDKLDADGRDCLEEIHTNAQKMGDLIDALLSLSRVTRGEMRRQRVDLGDLARSVVRELVTADTQRKVEVVIADNVQADIDPQLARALVENLLGNAWKFTKNVPRARIEFGTTQDGGSRAFFVRDNGAGFDMAYANKLFAPFQRLHTVAEYPGTGIGLATVQRIVRRHGGRIWAEGRIDAGATFYFTLPTASQGATTWTK